MSDKCEEYIDKNDRYSEQEAGAILSKLDNNCTPLPLIFKELYGARRIVFYSSEPLCRRFIHLINAFLFYYKESIIFCSDENFVFSGGEYEWTEKFYELKNINFLPGDMFFAFDLNCRKSVIDWVMNQNIKKLTVEVFRKAFIGSLVYYVFKIRPLKNFVALNPGVNVVLIDNFTPDYENLTAWEKYLFDNKLMRENMTEKLKNGEDPYPEGMYSQRYSTQELLSMHVVPDRVIDSRGVFAIKDYSSEYVNTSGGVRVTCGQPSVFKRTIHIFGGCGFFGVGVPDSSTFASRLQDLFNINAPQQAVKVVNHGSFIWGQHDAMWYMINAVAYNVGDIVVIPYNQKWAQRYYKNIPAIRYADVTARDNVEIFNDMWHPSEPGLKIYAENLFNFFKENNYLNDIPQTSEIKLCRPKIFGVPPFADAASGNNAYSLNREEDTEGLKKYLDKILVYKRNIGAIVMNCNPFTLGHRYLVEYAASRVEHLFIFVVEEDKSFFTFEDRIELVRSGTADIPNVTVLPSGKFIISSLTFTDYFGKAELQDKTIDATLDLEIFGRNIAPALDINIRFLREEPLDNVTRQYNEQMKIVLPKYGIKVIVVPRKEFDNKVISASRVRELLKVNDFTSIKQLVPGTTFEYLVNKFKC